MPTSNIKRLQVQDAALVLLDKELAIPLARFEVNFRLNEIPRATVIPTAGRLVQLQGKSARTGTLADISEGDRCVIKLKVSGVVYSLIEGFVQSINTDDTSSMFRRRQAARVVITHRAVKLAGAPAASFAYRSRSSDTLDLLYTHKNKVNPFLPSGTSASSVDGIAAFVYSILGKGDNRAYFPSAVLKDILMGLFREFNGSQSEDPHVSQVALDSMIQIYEPANLTKILPETTAFLRYIGLTYKDSWRGQNSWEALKKTANSLFLSLVPYSRGFYIANPYSLYRFPAKTIHTSEYIKMSLGNRADLSESKDGVVLTPPTGYVGDGSQGYISDVFTFPKLTYGNDASATVGKYYHFRPYPAWIQPLIHYLNGPSKEGSTFGEAPSPVFNGIGNISEYYKLVGNGLAQAMYGQIRQKQSTANITFPFRVDIMPGTNIKFLNSNQELSFIGAIIHGMTIGTTFVCDTLADNPVLQTLVEVTALRNDRDNSNVEHILTSDRDPIYEGHWVGISLNGELLSKEPGEAKISEVPGKTYNTTTGSTGS